MALPSSGVLTLNDIQTEFGGTNPIDLSDYYRGGGLVPDTARMQVYPPLGLSLLLIFMGQLIQLALDFVRQGLQIHGASTTIYSGVAMVSKSYRMVILQGML